MVIVTSAKPRYAYQMNKYNIFVNSVDDPCLSDFWTTLKQGVNHAEEYVQPIV